MIRYAPLLLLAACATAPRSAFPPIANMHSPTLCYVHYAGNVIEKQAAQDELGRRSFTCTARDLQEGREQWDRMAEASLQMQAQDRSSRVGDAALGLGLILLSRPPPPAPPPAPIHCYTSPNGQITTCR